MHCAVPRFQPRPASIPRPFPAGHRGSGRAPSASLPLGGSSACVGLSAALLFLVEHPRRAPPPLPSVQEALEEDLEAVAVEAASTIEFPIGEAPPADAGCLLGRGGGTGTGQSPRAGSQGLSGGAPLSRQAACRLTRLPAPSALPPCPGAGLQSALSWWTSCCWRAAESLARHPRCRWAELGRAGRPGGTTCAARPVMSAGVPAGVASQLVPLPARRVCVRAQLLAPYRRPAPRTPLACLCPRPVFTSDE